MVLAAYTYMTAVFLVRTLLGFGTSAEVTMVTTLSKVGELIDVFFLYVACRGLVHEVSDFRWLLEKAVFLLLPFVALVFIERFTWRNPLVILGSIPAIWVDAGDGRIRCFGSFLHPALLGTFGAIMALSYMGLAASRSSRAIGCIGVFLSLMIVILANSGGPITMLAAGMLAWGCWPIRERLKLLRFAILGMLILLAVIMRDPIWYLPSKMSILFGGGGWHRSFLMNQAIVHLDNWWLAGMPLDMTREWLPYLTLGAADVTNLYLSFGIDGGLMALFLLIGLLVVAFSEIGKSLVASRNARQLERKNELLLWALGASMVGHAANFLSITYFDQTTVVWLLQLAVIASASSTTNSGVTEKPRDLTQREGFGSRGGRRSYVARLNKTARRVPVGRLR